MVWFARLAAGWLEMVGGRLNVRLTTGGLYSTARDYIRFLQMLLNQGELDGVCILKAETVALMDKTTSATLGCAR